MHIYVCRNVKPSENTISGSENMNRKGFLTFFPYIIIKDFPTNISINSKQLGIFLFQWVPTASPKMFAPHLNIGYNFSCTHV